VNFDSGFQEVGISATVFALIFPTVVLGSKWWWARKEALPLSSTAVYVKETSSS
jgi:hypothetical protein